VTWKCRCGSVELPVDDDVVADGEGLGAVGGVAGVLRLVAGERGLAVGADLDPVDGEALGDARVAGDGDEGAAVVRGVRRAVGREPPASLRRRRDEARRAVEGAARRRSPRW
jgi:hypothetical protein